MRKAESGRPGIGLRVPTRSGVALLEVVLAMGLIACVLGGALSLSSQNTREHQEILERAVAEGLCLDVIERLKYYKTFWALPGEPAAPPLGVAGPPIEEMYGPVELRSGWQTLFDKVYLDHLAALGMTPRPTITRTPVKEVFGLFRLEVAVEWQNAGGHARRVKVARYCYAP